MGNGNSTGGGRPGMPGGQTQTMGAPAPMPMQTMGAPAPRPMGPPMAFPGQANDGAFPGQGGGVSGGFPGGGMPRPEMPGARPMHSQPMPMPQMQGEMNRDPRGVPAWERPTFPGQGQGVSGGFPGQRDMMMDRRQGIPQPAFNRPNAPAFPGQGAGGFGPQAFGVPGGTGPMPPQQMGGDQGQMARQAALERIQGMGLPPEVMQRIMSGWRG